MRATRAPVSRPRASRAGLRISITGRVLRSGSEPAQGRLQRVEPDRAQVERGGVERLQVERRTLAGPHLVARLQPDPLAHLVGRCLPRPAQVAVDLELDLAD